VIRLRHEGQEGKGLHDLAALGAGQLHPAVHADIGINPGDLQEVFIYVLAGIMGAGECVGEGEDGEKEEEG
jgi:hypothetical protein